MPDWLAGLRIPSRLQTISHPDILTERVPAYPLRKACLAGSRLVPSSSYPGLQRSSGLAAGLLYQRINT
jgi:hypothetical protein